MVFDFTVLNPPVTLSRTAALSNSPVLQFGNPGDRILPALALS